MPEVNQYVFAPKELLELMVKKAGVHEGKWMLTINFAFTAINGGPTPDQVVPAAVVGVQGIGIQRAVPEAPPALVIDAAEVIRRPEEEKSRKD